MSNYQQEDAILITITTNDRIMLDRFFVTHWRSPEGERLSEENDVENTGSHASESILLERIKRYIKEVPSAPSAITGNNELCSGCGAAFGEEPHTEGCPSK